MANPALTVAAAPAAAAGALRCHGLGGVALEAVVKDRGTTTAGFAPAEAAVADAVACDVEAALLLLLLLPEAHAEVDDAREDVVCLRIVSEDDVDEMADG